ncbi:MAG TPA: hypothetical protein VHN11_07500 [Xanthobacteraceae bacterium]|jgi:hypothetical protein|nr:hypothetical protein [Xanthobacteraceae bacterium]
MHFSGRGAIILLGGLGLASVAVLAAMPPITQDQHYHAFADTRPLFGIPYFWNVISNLPFVVVGAAGLALFRGELTSAALFFGILLTGFGSSYYHLAPDDGTLFWDRLPMTIGFMALLAGALGERFGKATGHVALWPLLALGGASLIWWRWTGDLRPYVWVQFYPCLVLPILYWWFPAMTGSRFLIIATALYGVSKALEYFDHLIYAASGIMSGHTLKHLAAAAACFALLRYFKQRQPLPKPINNS